MLPAFALAHRWGANSITASQPINLRDGGSGEHVLVGFYGYGKAIAARGDTSARAAHPVQPQPDVRQAGAE